MNEPKPSTSGMFTSLDRKMHAAQLRAEADKKAQPSNRLPTEGLTSTLSTPNNNIPNVPRTVMESVPEAMATLKTALVADPEYAQTWHDNLAMAILDEMNAPATAPTSLHEIANQAAARFLATLAPGCDTSEHAKRVTTLGHIVDQTYAEEAPVSKLQEVVCNAFAIGVGAPSPADLQAVVDGVKEPHDVSGCHMRWSRETGTEYLINGKWVADMAALIIDTTVTLTPESISAMHKLGQTVQWLRGDQFTATQCAELEAKQMHENRQRSRNLMLTALTEMAVSRSQATSRELSSNRTATLGRDGIWRYDDNGAPCPTY